MGYNCCFVNQAYSRRLGKMPGTKAWHFLTNSVINAGRTELDTQRSKQRFLLAVLD